MDVLRIFNVIADFIPQLNGGVLFLSTSFQAYFLFSLCKT